MLLGENRRVRLEYRTRFRVAVILVILAWLVLGGRLFHVQVMQHDRYARLAQVSAVGRERVAARRGRILDRNGRELARNVDTHRLVVVPHYVEDLEGELTMVRDILEMTDERFDRIMKKILAALESRQRRFQPITVSRWLTSDFCPHDGSSLSYMEALEVSRCPDCDREYIPLDIARTTRCPVDQHKLRYSLNRRMARCPRCDRTYVMPDQHTCPHDKAALRASVRNHTCSICGRDYLNQYAALNARMHELPGFDIETHMRRLYPHRHTVSHLVGYMNEVTKEELEANPDELRMGDTIGRTGLERAFEGALRGTHGDELFAKDAKGFRRNPNRIQTLYTELQSAPPEDGDNIRLTIDIRVQALLEESLRYAKSGAAVVIDPMNGEVLGLYSAPSFDPNLSIPIPRPRQSQEQSDKRQAEKVARDRYSPQVNKALTAYAPGSVFKIVTSLAGLMEGLIDERSSFKCPGFYRYKKRRFRCHNLGGHGKVKLIEALAHSCDVYFYKLGELLGLDTISWYAREYFGFGEPTGIELREQGGRTPTVKWYNEEMERGFLPGYTLSVAVGQGALIASPLQVARSFAVLLNGGDLLRLRLVRAIEDDAGNPTKVFDREVVRHLDIPREYVDLIREGLFQVVNEEGATAYNVHLVELPMGGKTGTAEAREHRAGVEDEDFKKWLLGNHAWFVGYAPADSPKVVVVAFLEHGGSGGRHAAPIVQHIITKYFERRLGNIERSR